MREFFIALLIKIHNIWYRELQGKFFFLHIPKCGGQSLDAAIRRHYPFSNVHVMSIASFNAATLMYQLDDPTVEEFDDMLKFREHLLVYYMSRPNIKYISGHFSFSDIAYRHFHETYNYITLLRDPVKRWISNYFFHRYKPEHSDYNSIEEDLSAFLQSGRGKHEGQLYVRMVGGIDPSGDYSSYRAIERAKANLHKFELVGCLEYFDDFLKQFEHRFGVKLKVFKKNQNPKSPAYIQSVLTKEIEETITRLCQPDLEIYNYARDTFVKTYC